MLAEEIKKQMFAAMKARDTVMKEILRVVLGEVDVLATRTGQKLDDDQVAGVLRKLTKANEETLALARSEEEKSTLKRELQVLQALLPKTLDVQQTVQALADVRSAVLDAKGDGPATGLAMKHLKGSGAAVDGKTVAAAVRQIRAG